MEKSERLSDDSLRFIISMCSDSNRVEPTEFWKNIESIARELLELRRKVEELSEARNLLAAAKKKKTMTLFWPGENIWINNIYGHST